MTNEGMMLIGEALFCLLDVLLLFRAAQVFLTTKDNHKFKFWGVTFLTSFLIFSATVSTAFSSFVSIIMGVLLVVYVFVLFDGSVFAKVMSAIVYYLLLGIITILVISAVVKITNIQVDVLMGATELRMIVMFGIKTITIILIELLRRLLGPKQFTQDIFVSNYTLGYLVVNLLVIIVLFDIVLTQDYIISKNLIFYFIIIQTILISIMFMIISNYFEMKVKNETYQTMIDAFNLYQKREVERVESDVEVLKLKHDLKNHMASLSYMIESGKDDEARNYIHELIHHEALKTYVNTPNPVINAIVNSKITQNPHIHFVTRVGISEFKIEPYDLTVLLGNALDNAIEAAGKCERNRVVKLYLEENSQFCKIQVLNTFHEMPRMKDGVYLSSKRLGDKRGFGMVAMKETTNKYLGRMGSKIEDDYFKLTLILSKSS